MPALANLTMEQRELVSRLTGLSPPRLTELAEGAQPTLSEYAALLTVVVG